MAMTYTVLTGLKTTAGSIKSVLNYDHSAFDADGVMVDAQNWIYQRLRVTEMRATANLSVISGTETVALPTDFLDSYGVIRNTLRMIKIRLINEDDLEETRSYDAAVLRTGKPSWFGIYNGVINFDCKPDESFTGRFPYYKKPAMLAGSTTNFLTDKYSHILRPVTTAFGAVFMKDTKMYAQELQRASGFIDDANAQDELTRRGEETMPMGDFDGGAYFPY